MAAARQEMGAGRHAGEQPQGAAGSSPSGRVRGCLWRRRRCRRPAEASLKLPGEPGESFPVSPPAAARRPPLHGSRRSQERTGRHAPGDHPHGLLPARNGSAFRRTYPTPMPRSPQPRCRRNWPARSCRPPGTTLPDAAGLRAAEQIGAAFQRALTEEIASRFTADADAGPRTRTAAHRRPGGTSRVGQDDHAGQTRGELRPGRPPAGPAALHGYLSCRGRRSTAFLRRDPGGRFSVARNGIVAGSDHRGKPRQGTDLHRYPGLGLRRSGRFGEPGALSRHARTTSIRTWCCRPP